ncbi:MAG: penicillin-binding protein [SAR324 cluster bacterium]|uniref:Penicillin-binding protein n=1 Tax=SAR324 cluster bacterium TaxID=2024889 RepID=A0A2A4SUB0_9DELT|nr:MAG: penicillin-binding protein [SAR324 cluster bacterium]
MQSRRASNTGKTRFRILIVLSSLLILSILTGWFFHFKAGVVEKFIKIQAAQSNNTIFYDIKNQPFHIIRGQEDRKYKKLPYIHGNLQKSVIAIEDSRFFKHFGFDPIRITSAIFRLLKWNASVHGASTITQQLVKLTLLTPERTISRKVKELLMAVALEMEFSKKQILEYYLNKVYLGHRNYGVENAALNYFHKSARNLTLAESAFIAGLIKKPEGYSPYSDLNKARKRQVVVLKRLRTLNWISVKEYNEAVSEKILIRRRRESDLRMAAYFTNHILLQLKQKYGHRSVYGGGLRVYTTLDRDLQQKMEQTIAKRLQAPKSFEQVAGISIDPQNGFVKALVGGVDFSQSEFNRATQARRQPGSAFKPILYATALTRGLLPTDVFIDEPTPYTNLTLLENEEEELEVYEPTNFSNEHLGPITLSYALRVSNNVVSVQILDKIGISPLVRTARRFGINIPGQQGLCLALGCGETSLLNLVNAYTVFANQGKKNEPVFILRVTDSTGKILEEYKPQKALQVLSEDQSYQMNRMLQNVVNYGTGRAAKIDREVGGKTGTSDGYRDAWFVGYTSDLVTGFWIGNDDNKPMDGEVGGRTPARLWKALMQQLPKSERGQEFGINENFEDFEICDTSGKAATPWCPQKSWYPLKKGLEPIEFCDVHNEPNLEIQICRVSGLLASQYCPIEDIESKKFYEGTEPTAFCNIHTAEQHLQNNYSEEEHQQSTNSNYLEMEIY